MPGSHTTRPQPWLRPDDANSAVYWPVLGLVDGPGFVLGVGLVVLGVSVPVPPMLEPLLDAPPELLEPPDVPEVPAEPVAPVLPDVPEVPELPDMPDGAPDVP
jgi:hypothetical protein